MANVMELAVKAVAVMTAMVVVVAVEVEAARVPGSNCVYQLMCTGVLEAQIHVLTKTVSCDEEEAGPRVAIKRFNSITAQHMPTVMDELLRFYVGRGGVFAQAARLRVPGVTGAGLSLSANALYGTWSQPRTRACFLQSATQKLLQGPAKVQIRHLNKLRKKFGDTGLVCAALRQATVLNNACAALAPSGPAHSG